MIDHKATIEYAGNVGANEKVEEYYVLTNEHGEAYVIPAPKVGDLLDQLYSAALSGETLARILIKLAEISKP